MRRRRTKQATIGLVAALLLLPTIVWTQTEGLADRVVAVVDDDPILASEIGQIIALDIVEREEDEDDESYERRVLDMLIEQKLRFHEVDRFGFAEVPVEAVQDELERIEQSIGGKEALDRRLQEAGLTRQDLRQIVARQVMVLIYVEERLGARVFVGLEDIRQYYDEVLVPQLQQQAKVVPPLPEVRESIRALLREQRMNEEFEKWTMELRSAADIEDFFASRQTDLPPVVSTLKASE